MGSLLFRLSACYLRRTSPAVGILRKARFSNCCHEIITSDESYSTAYPPSRMLPWLMLPPSKDGDGGGDILNNLYSPAHNKVVRIRGGGGDVADDDTKRRINLPPIHTLPNSKGGLSCAAKVVVSSSPNAGDCRVVMSYGPEERLAFYCPCQSSEWTPIGAWYHEDDGKKTARVYEDFAYSRRQNRLFCITQFLDLERWDLEDLHSPRIDGCNEVKYDDIRAKWSKVFGRGLVEVVKIVPRLMMRTMFLDLEVVQQLEKTAGHLDHLHRDVHRNVVVVIVYIAEASYAQLMIQLGSDTTDDIRAKWSKVFGRGLVEVVNVHQFSSKYLEEEEDEAEAEPIREVKYVVVAEQSNEVFVVVRKIMEQMGMDGSYVKRICYDEDNRNHGVSEDSYPYKTVGFDVYKIEIVGEVDCGGKVVMRLRYVEGSLNGLAMFVGINHSVALAADQLKADSIYFTDPKELTPSGGNYGYCGYDGHDVGIFDYKNYTFSPCYYPSTVQGIARITHAPFWFTPTPH
ncbi:hypothetical protein C2S53_017755 [Perilla frutescens var. hirtella]|uniref:KIB1-4 beta-propeller domain-containing protein n=1 Tax=Perilla frutescens var. hirtella TaxID=608512 RepID=A0AAD4IWX6_PERFH|nr:hypothetical protein C2S53_017755 [Perilla frutescens var. hirtella]